MIKQFEEFIAEARQDILAMINKHGYSEEELIKIKRKDPSNGKFLPWILKQLNSIDLTYREWNALKDYHSHLVRGILPVELRDINRIDGVDKLVHIANLYNRKLSRKDVDSAARSGADKVFEDEKILILNINTYEASRKYGKGTKWCISGNDDAGHFNVRIPTNYIFFVYLKDRTDDLYKLCILRNRRDRNILKVYDATDIPTDYWDFLYTVDFKREYGIDMMKTLTDFILAKQAKLRTKKEEENTSL